MSKFKFEIGKRIQQIRKNLGYSQQQIAQELSIPRPSVSQIERGEREVTAEELAKLSVIFKMTIDEILKFEEPQKKKPSEGDILVTFFRHGEASDDLFDQYGGWADPDLSPRGVNKSFLISQDLVRKGVNYDVIYTSPLNRAKQKAEILARELHTSVKVLQYLKERNTYGLLCGINKDVAKKLYPDLVDAYESGKYVLASERQEDFESRIKFIFDYIQRSGNNNVCCVTHRIIIFTILKNFLNMNPNNLEDGCMLVVGIDKEKVYLVQSEGITFSK